MLPEIVLLGLIFVSLGPLKIFPKRIPPISEDIHINKIMNNIILKWISFKPKIKINRKINKYITNKKLEINLFKYFFLKYNFDILENSINAKEKMHIDANKYTIYL